MLVTPPCGASSNIALWRAKIKPPVELVVGDLESLNRKGVSFSSISFLNFANMTHFNTQNTKNAKRPFITKLL